MQTTKEKKPETLHKKKPLRRIGMFDSGIGGLTVAKPLMQSFPAEYIYIADTAYAPYGNKSIQVIEERVDHLINELIRKNVEAIICACHTASSITIEKLNLNIPIFGMIDASIHELNNPKVVALFGTQQTVDSHLYAQNITARYPDCIVHEVACPELATIIETELHSPDFEAKVLDYLHNLMPAQVDTVILGCTHYTIAEHLFKQIVSSDVKIISSTHFAKQFTGEFSALLKESSIILHQTGNDTHWSVKAKAVLHPVKKILL